MCSLEIANNGMERQPLGASLFSCCAYTGDLHDYIGSRVPPHWHHEFELLMVDCGEMLVSLAGNEFHLKSGEGYFLTSDKLHSVSCMTDSPCRYRSLVFEPSIVSGATGSSLDTKYVRPLIENGPCAFMLQRSESWQDPIFSAFEESFSACAEEPFGYEFSVRHALSQMVLSLAAHNNIRRSLFHVASQGEERLKQMMQWIDAAYGQPVTLRSLADAVSISSRECERVFKQLLHISPMKYLLQRRITAASELLTCSDLPIIEVGLQCGFSSHSYFTKQFHNMTGYTPRDYRTRVSR
jgi:AraC-like DNA-binding protein